MGLGFRVWGGRAWAWLGLRLKALGLRFLEFEALGCGGKSLGGSGFRVWTEGK